MKDSKEEVACGGGGRDVWWGQGDPVILYYKISSKCSNRDSHRMALDIRVLRSLCVPSSNACPYYFSIHCLFYHNGTHHNLSLLFIFLQTRFGPESNSDFHLNLQLRYTVISNCMVLYTVPS